MPCHCRGSQKHPKMVIFASRIVVTQKWPFLDVFASHDITFVIITWTTTPGTLSLTHWGRVTHICVSKLAIIGSDNGLSPGRHQAIIRTNAGILLIGPLETNFIENIIQIYTFSFKKMHLKMSSGKWRPFCLGLNVLSHVTATHLRIGHLEISYPLPVKQPRRYQ